MPAELETVERVRRIDVDQYRYGFETIIESEKAPKGLSEDTVRFISEKKNEPACYNKAADYKGTYRLRLKHKDIKRCPDHSLWFRWCGGAYA